MNKLTNNEKSILIDLLNEERNKAIRISQVLANRDYLNIINSILNKIYETETIN